MFVDQSIPDGSYEGRLGNLPVVLHLLRNGGGSPLLTIDSPDQGVFGLECVDVTIAGRALKFKVPLIKGSWSGVLEADDLALSGTWMQGSASPLRFVRNMFVASATPPVVDGIWLGQFDVDVASPRVQLIVRTDHRGHLLATLDSIDQRKTGLACTNVFFDNDRLSFEVPYVHGRWAGTLSPDRNRLVGRWKQKSDRALDFERQARATNVQPLPPPRMLPGLPPVPVAELGPLLSRDFGDALQNGWLASGSPGGAVIGISQGSERSIVAFGVANADSIFEIGSVSKTFTGLLLAQLVAQGKVDLHDPIGQLLPIGAVSTPALHEITLLDLSTHHSGLPRSPSNMRRADPNDPYADYDADLLLAFLRTHGTAKPENPCFGYSNVGAGLLGYLLANRANAPYSDLLRAQILDPLGMKDTAIALTVEQQALLIQGHRASGRPTTPWNLNILAGAGGLRASAGDMLTYLEAFSDPQSLCGASGTSETTLSVALEEAQKPRVRVNETLTMCLGWLYQHEGDIHWHNGGTGGYTSYAAFSQRSKRSIVVLVNAARGEYGQPAEVIGRYVVERLDGRDAIWPGTALPGRVR